MTTTTQRPGGSVTDIDVCEAIERKVLWLSTVIIDAANAPTRKDPGGLNIGGHPHTLAFLTGVRSVNLGVNEFGQTCTLQDMYRLHGIGADAQVAAALDLVVDRSHAH